ncbi:MAG: 23S rRNA (adenine(2503)-C(2))-methyltransferase RlmN [Candidatus Riflebacteria bacterium]|nr:23S rRNA (adenine(2503)-C(2))-methyltransferase RlmN [Candidatus Riflebacteria bacterium]
MSSNYLLSNGLKALVDDLTALGLEKYRARQVWDWIFKKNVFEYSKMTNLPLEVRTLLSEKFPEILPESKFKQKAEDGTVKLGLALHDGSVIETVAIPSPESVTFCLSSQVGCTVSCGFCKTGKMGFKRNLSSEEIIIQVLCLIHETGSPPGNIVFMGMGEPFLNRKALFPAIDMLTEKTGMGLATRRITVSTVGIPDGIYDLADRKGEVNLALSLHAADDYTRSSLIPINEKFPLEVLRESIVHYISVTNRRVTFEYTLLRGINDGLENVLNLINFCEGLLCHVNIVRFNSFPGCGYKPSEQAAEKEFKKALKKAGIPVTIRASHGGDILAACGQLGAENISERKNG